MLGLLLRRLLLSVPLLLATSLITQLLLAAAPGDYASRLADDPRISPAYLAELRHRFHLDEGLFSRYLAWLKHAIRGDLGYSFHFEEPVSALIAERVGHTALLTGSALLFAWSLALPLALFAATHHGRALDHTIRIGAMLCLSVPRVLLALLLLLFAALTGLFPTGGMRSLFLDGPPSPGRAALDLLHHLCLPALALGLGQLAYVVRTLRAQLLEELGRPYVRTALAKGLSPARVALRHALPNALNPLITVFGYGLASLLTGAFLVEVIFSWPGLATLTMDALLAQDEPLVLASVLLATVMLLVGNLIADLLLAALDPRVRAGR